MIHELVELLDIGLPGDSRTDSASQPLPPPTREVRTDDAQRRGRVEGQEVEALGNVGQPADGDQGFSPSPPESE